MGQQIVGPGAHYAFPLFFTGHIQTDRHRIRLDLAVCCRLTHLAQKHQSIITEDHGNKLIVALCPIGFEPFRLSVFQKKLGYPGVPSALIGCKIAVSALGFPANIQKAFFVEANIQDLVVICAAQTFKPYQFTLGIQTYHKGVHTAAGGSGMSVFRLRYANGNAASVRKRQHLVILLWKHTVILRYDLLGSLFQIPHPAVVAKTFPELMQKRVVTGSQSLHIRERLEKTGIVTLHCLHPGLLQHDLRDPDMVRLPVRAPGQFPAIFQIPRQQKLGQSLQNNGFFQI